MQPTGDQNVRHKIPRQIIYQSTALLPRGHIGDLDILRTALTRNRALGLTGYLLRNTHGFLQALEGDGPAVEAVFASIQRDTRHANIRLLCDCLRPARDFEDWSMGYDDIGQTALPAEPVAARQLLRQHAGAALCA